MNPCNKDVTMSSVVGWKTWCRSCKHWCDWIGDQWNPC